MNLKKVGVLTSGGDAPGMNAAIRAFVRLAINAGMEVYGIERGYVGLINASFRRMDGRSVSDIIHRGGTILKTARCPEFMTKEGIKKGADVAAAFGLEGLAIIGGDGSFYGALDLFEQHGIPCVGIPGTIDNDLAYTDFTLGFDTSVNTVLSAINNIRDTMTSHDRACIIEVMGRKCGDIALYSGLAGGAEAMIVPEIPFDINALCTKIKQNIIKGKTSDIIILAEGVCDCDELKKQIEANVDIVMRTVKLGYIQRGGTPTLQDRVFAARCAERAVALLSGNYKDCRLIGIQGNQIVDVEAKKALKQKRDFNKNLYDIACTLGK